MVAGRSCAPWTASISSGAAARRSASSASPAAASRRSRARSSASSRRATARSSSRASPSTSDLKALRRRVQLIFQDPYQSMNPRRTVGAQVQEGLAAIGMRSGDDARAAGGHRAARCRSHAGRPLLGALPARALGRPAPACRDRRRARARARGARLRRARLGARRLGADAGAAPARRPSRLAAALAAADHPRRRPRLVDVRPRGGHVPGAHRRDRHDRAGARRSAAPVHEGAPRGGSPDRAAQRRPGAAAGRAAGCDRDPERLPLPPALPGRVRPLPGGRSVPAGVRAGRGLLARARHARGAGPLPTA